MQDPQIDSHASDAEYLKVIDGKTLLKKNANARLALLKHEMDCF